MKRFLALTTLLALLALPGTSLAKAGLPDFTDLAERAGKAVVNISTTKNVASKGSQIQELFKNAPKNHPLRDFFEQFERQFGQQDTQPRKLSSLGSGFIISTDGYIVTNNHVVAEADEIKVKLLGRDKPYDAKIIGRDAETDLALLKIEAGGGLPVLEFGNSDSTRVGEWVLAIGNPFGLGHTVTAGIVSAKGRHIGAGPFDSFLQTDASINPGNSGGPLIDMDGKVVGINTAIVPNGQGIGFATPATMADKIIQQLKTGQKIMRGWLGITMQELDENTARAVGLKDTKGVLVAHVIPGDPADKGGLKIGDVIMKVNGQSVDGSSALLARIASLRPGEKIQLGVWRQNRMLDLSITLGERKPNFVAEQQDKGSKSKASAILLGLSIRPVEGGEEAQSLGLQKPQGLLIMEIQQGTSAAQIDILPGDVIIEANQQAVNTVDQLKSLVADSKQKGLVMLLLKRQGRNLLRAIPLDKK
ncbi:MAG: Do family serine endopeptidase [Humidesulfovibrio sp.]|uniref:Do family serine endopeptidase n=1 Tax=Humidesulfovibrio sp. TaxID=2910988 RepID=UPI0027368EA2|nr:Do family serine endopeptidase [Humidesulfovibrio sp.]MDP2847904.1 Do family serine endopeptidase [Humidesulfovibrio sp.]